DLAPGSGRRRVVGAPGRVPEGGSAGRAGARAVGDAARGAIGRDQGRRGGPQREGLRGQPRGSGHREGAGGDPRGAARFRSQGARLPGQPGQSLHRQPRRSRGRPRPGGGRGSRGRGQVRALLDLLREGGPPLRPPRGLRALRRRAGGRVKTRFPYFLLMAGVVVLDQITKGLVVRAMELHEYRSIVDGLLSLSHVQNRGAAFGILSDADLPYQAALFSTLSFVALLAIAVYAYRLPLQSRRPQIALALVLGGAVGNLLDRVRLGYVVDFIHVYWRQHQWPDFNVADSAITVGVALLILDILRSPQPARVGKTEMQEMSPAGRTD